jgi:hypothetical protein
LKADTACSPEEVDMEVKITISDTLAGGGVMTPATAVEPGVTMAGVQGAQRGYGIQAGAAGMQAGSLVQPPADLLRAAAALGAQSAGPAPMLTGGGFGASPGEPQQFTTSGSEPVAMATLGAPDQSGGAAPGADMTTLAETIAEQPE